MSRVQFTKSAQPATPAANKALAFIDTNDRRLKSIDDNGVVCTMNNDGLQDRNILDNGGLMIQQRVATGSTAISGISNTARSGVVADRWCVVASVASNLNWAQIDSSGSPETGLVARYYGSMISSVSGKKMMLSQYLIFNQMAHLRGKKVRFSLKLNQKAGSGQTYKLGIIQLQSTGAVDGPPLMLSGAWSTVAGTDPAWNTNTAAVAPDSTPSPENGTVSGSYINVVSQAATWVRYSGVWTIPSNCKGIFVVLFSDATSGTTDNLSVAELQLTEGPDVVDFVQTPPDEELTRCQRFFCKTFPQTTVPVQNASINTGELKWTKVVAGATAGRTQWRFPVTMWRTPPVITSFNPAAANIHVRDETNTVDCSATSVVGTTDAQVGITYTGNAATVAEGLMGLHLTADAEILS